MSAALTENEIDYVAQLAQARSVVSGAIVLFLGAVRDVSEGRGVLGLDYETYPAMAMAKLEEILAEAKLKWPLHHASISHRYGRLQLADVAVAVVTASMHRAEAFAAAEWIMDAVKRRAPIWKRENWADGGAEWRHPTGGEGSQCAVS